jgi:CheY-like chemotaxis protein
MTTDPVVLLVDDSPNDALLMTTVFHRTDFDKPLRFVTSGEDVIAYLQGEGRFHDRAEFPMPAIVLLDLNMPRMNGLEVLAWIRGQPRLRRLCTFVLSASNRPEDIEKAYDLGANGYLVKPGNLSELAQMARTFVAWIKLGHFATPAPGVEEPAPPALPIDADLIGLHWVG